VSRNKYTADRLIIATRGRPRSQRNQNPSTFGSASSASQTTLSSVEGVGLKAEKWILEVVSGWANLSIWHKSAYFENRVLFWAYNVLFKTENNGIFRLLWLKRKGTTFKDTYGTPCGILQRMSASRNSTGQVFCS
jgi:hypothetical protein